MQLVMVACRRMGTSIMDSDLHLTGPLLNSNNFSNFQLPFKLSQKKIRRKRNVKYIHTKYHQCTSPCSLMC